MKKLIIPFILILAALTLSEANAEEVIQIDPLFEYPVAPESLTSLEEKCNYLVANFWNNYNFKNKKVVDQYALNDAFQVYVTPFQFADKKIVDQSVEKLLKEISSNPLLMLQFCKAAEENLYGPRAQFWSDEVYLKFLEAVVKNKKIDNKRKNKYITQTNILKASAIGQPAPNFWFQDKERASKRYFPMSTPTILIFGNPDDTDWRLQRLKMESNFQLSEAVEKGKINIIYIVPEEIDNWSALVSNYNKNWTVGQSSEVSKSYDLRLQPSVFFVGADGNISSKNISIAQAIDEALASIKQ